MRNWNRAIESESPQTGGFQTTYEELKLESWIWIEGGIDMLPDYLWGIETLSLAEYVCERVSFQTTYEELKLFSNDTVRILLKLPDYLWGIETTFFVLLILIQLCFQTTYEELKPF